MTRIEPFNVSNERLDEPDKLQAQARARRLPLFPRLIMMPILSITCVKISWKSVIGTAGQKAETP